MRYSLSICTGVKALGQLSGGWSLKMELTNTCFIAGMTIMHKYEDPGTILNIISNVTTLPTLCPFHDDI